MGCWANHCSMRVRNDVQKYGLRSDGMQFGHCVIIVSEMTQASSMRVRHPGCTADASTLAIRKHANHFD